MTTIAYDHDKKVIALDSRITRFGVIESDTYNKVIATENAIYVFAGSPADMQRFIELAEGAQFANDDLDIDALKVKNGKVFHCSVCKEAGYWELELEFNIALGSGYRFALAAMDMGKTAHEAIEYAKTRDLYTGGNVRLLHVNENGITENSER